MAIALVTSVAAGSPDNNSVTSGSVDTSGSSLLVLAASTGSALTPTDSKSNTWNGLTARVGLFSGQLQLWYAVSPSVGSGHTFTLTGTSEGSALCVLAFSGTATASPFDVENGTNNTTNPSAGSVTPSVNNCVVVTASGIFSNGGHSTIGAPFTLQQFVDGVGGAHWDVAIAYEIQTTATTRNPAWTAADAAAVVAVFKPASAVVTTRNRLALLGAA